MTNIEFRIGNWTPVIGDPSFWGWFTVFSYYGAAAVCFLLALLQRKPDRRFWLSIFFIMVLLGLCKQFNLLSALTEAGRLTARSQGWIKKRRIVQTVFMTAGPLFGTAVAVVYIRKKSNTFFIRRLPTLIWIFYLSEFIIIRAISLHSWEKILSFKILGFKMNWIGELLGIYGVCVSALFYYFQKRRDG